jgi:hypothetical protein
LGILDFYAGRGKKNKIIGDKNVMPLENKLTDH